MDLGEPQSAEELVVFLDIGAAGAEVDLCDVGPEGKEGGEDGDDHEAIVPARVLVVGLQEFVGKVEYGCLFVVDEVVERLVEFAGDDEVEAVDLLRHQYAKLLVQLASLQIILLEDDASVAAFDHHYFHVAGHL